MTYKLLVRASYVMPKGTEDNESRIEFVVVYDDNTGEILSIEKGIYTENNLNDKIIKEDAFTVKIYSDDEYHLNFMENSVWVLETNEPQPKFEAGDSFSVYAYDDPEMVWVYKIAISIRY